MSRCPLCLEPVRSKTVFHSFCPICGATRTFGGRHVLSAECETSSCRERTAIREGLFLAHEGCACRNPFWDESGKRIVPPGDSLRLELNQQRSLQVKHWELQVLAQAAARFGNLPAMWFPAALLRASDGSGSGVCVKFSGARNVGKTTLATVALNPATYARSFRTEAVAVDGRFESLDEYVYVTPGEREDPAVAREFALGLYPSSLIEGYRGDSADWVEGTKAGHPNLKAIFYQERNALPAAPSRSRRVLRGATRLIEDLVGNVREDPGPARTGCMRVVACYDTPGEDNERPVLASLVRLDRVMGAVAFFLDATELSCFASAGADGSNSRMLPTLLLRMRSTPSRLRSCLVVTKLDLVRASLVKPEEVALLEQIESGERGLGSDDREFLLDWLGRGRRNGPESDLATLIRKHPRMPVFLVWIDGLKESREFPVGRGIARFVGWCLKGAAPVSSEVE